MAQSKKDNKKEWAIRIGLAVILIAALLISLIWTDAINAKFGLTETSLKASDGGEDDQSVLTLGDDMYVHFVDVGQGDACVIELPDDRTILIDAGDTHSENKTRLINYIKDNINQPSGEDIEYFDYVILTHPDSDHCGGMADVLAKYPAKVFYRPNVYTAYHDGEEDDDFVDPAKDEIIASSNGNKNNVKDTAAYDNAIKAGYNASKVNGVESTVYISDATNEDISTITPEGLEPTDANYYTFTFYAPLGAKSYPDNNNYSPVMILDYHGKRFMLSGDAEKEAEADFVAAAKEGKGKYSVFTDTFTVDVFKLGHHGSRTSSSEDMIRTMTTEANRPNVIAVISCGEGNSYGHPHQEVLDRLSSLGFGENNIVRTDVSGTVTMSVKGVANGDGTYSYELKVGDETVRHTATVRTLTVKIGNETIHLTWFEIVILGIIVVVLVLIVTPAVRQMKRAARKAAREAGITVSQSSAQRTSGTKKNSSGAKKNTTNKKK